MAVGENGQLRSQLRIAKGSEGEVALTIQLDFYLYKLEMSHVLEVDRLLFIDVPDGGDASLDELAKPHQCPGPVAEGVEPCAPESGFVSSFITSQPATKEPSQCSAWHPGQ